MANLFNLSGRVAVVIGATSGLGRTIALGLAEYGADVVPTGRREDKVRDVSTEIEAQGRTSFAYASDVRDRQSIDRLRDAVLERFSRVDILINAAGHTLKRPAAEIGEAEWASLFDTNVQGVLRACQSFYEPLKASGRGRVVNIASLGSYLAFQDVATYCASKSAVLSLTKSMACEWARDGICVNAIAPGIFPTDLNRAFITGTPRGDELLMRTPMHRFGKAEELIGAAVLLASDGASFITGQCLAVDGGYLASGVNARA